MSGSARKKPTASAQQNNKEERVEKKAKKATQGKEFPRSPDAAPLQAGAPRGQEEGSRSKGLPHEAETGRHFVSRFFLQG
jgi:hypothetical protein